MRERARCARASPCGTPPELASLAFGLATSRLPRDRPPCYSGRRRVVWRRGEKRLGGADAVPFRRGRAYDRGHGCAYACTRPRTVRAELPEPHRRSPVLLARVSDGGVSAPPCTRGRNHRRVLDASPAVLGELPRPRRGGAGSGYARAPGPADRAEHEQSGPHSRCHRGQASQVRSSPPRGGCEEGPPLGRRTSAGGRITSWFPPRHQSERASGGHTAPSNGAALQIPRH